MDHLLKKRIDKFKETGHSRYIYQNKLDKACFQREMAYEDFKNLLRRKASDKVLRDKVFNIAKNPKYDGCHILGPLMETSLMKNIIACPAKSVIMSFELLTATSRFSYPKKHFWSMNS